MSLRLLAPLLAVAAAGLVVSTADAQDGDDGARRTGGESVLAIVGGDVHVGNGIVYRRGTVLCRGGKILDVGSDLDVPEGARVIDAKGRWVLPGFVAPNGANFGIQRGRPRPGEKYADCLDPESMYAELALASGITCYYASGRLRGIAGDQTAIIKPAFGAPELMMVKEPAALEVNWSAASVTDRGSYRTTLEAAQRFIEAGKKGRAPAPSSVIAALERKIPVRVRAQDRGDILQAIAFAKEFDFRLVIDQAHESWTVAGEVAASGAICVVQPRTRRWPTPGKEDSSGTTIECAAILEKAGVPFCVLPPGGFGANPAGISMGGVVGRDLLTYPLEGAFAVRGGATPEAALRAITLTAAEALGIEGRVGSLERGKDADVVIYQGDPFDYRLMPEVTIVSGRILYERTKSALFGHLPPR
jgi:imidazolonepropionase-like amidohydrolase